jgi:hypothetical protein
MYRFAFVYKAHGKWNRQLSTFRYKVVVKDYLWILSMYSRCNCSHGNLFILCTNPVTMEANDLSLPWVHRYLVTWDPLDTLRFMISLT